MYGNFDAIKRRENLRKDVTISRKERVNNHKNSLARSLMENVFPEIPEAQINSAKNDIQENAKQDRHQNQRRNIIIYSLAIAITGFIIWRYIYPFLF